MRKVTQGTRGRGDNKRGIWSWDPGSGRRNKPIPDPGVKKAPDPGAVLSLTVDKVIQSSLFQAPGRAGTGQQQLLSEV